MDVNTILAQTRHHLMTAKPDLINTLDGAHSANTTTITLANEVRGISPGTVLAIDLSEYSVVSINNNVATVIPNVNGSISVAHASGSIVYVSPQFSPFRCAMYINEALGDLSAMGMFRIKSATDITFVPSQNGYDLAGATDIIDIWRVRYDIPGPSQAWPIMNRDQYELDLNADTTDFPSGKSLTVKTGYPGHAIRVSYKAGFDDLFNFSTFNPATGYTADVLTTTGLHEEAHNLLPMMSAIYLLGGRDIKRTFLYMQPEPRRQEEVPVGGASQSMRPLLQMITDGIAQERRRLKRRYPDQIR